MGSFKITLINSVYVMILQYVVTFVICWVTVWQQQESIVWQWYWSESFGWSDQHHCSFGFSLCCDFHLVFPPHCADTPFLILTVLEQHREESGVCCLQNRQHFPSIKSERSQLTFSCRSSLSENSSATGSWAAAGGRSCRHLAAGGSREHVEGQPPGCFTNLFLQNFTVLSVSSQPVSLESSWTLYHY